MRRLVAPLLLAVLLAACRGASTPPTAVPSSQAAPTATPSGSFLTIDEAGAAYFAVADPYNAAIDRAEAQYGARQSLKDHQQYWALIAKADQAFIDGLKKIAFPPDIQPAATVLIKADEAFQQRAVVASKSRSIAEVISLSAVANDASEVVADKAALLRDALGLEPYAG